jgi:Spy/CpxP family protein refolding chaperone
VEETMHRNFRFFTGPMPEAACAVGVGSPAAAFGFSFGGPDSFSGEAGAFGVRRPLRFLAHRLEMDEEQVAELAAILNELKTERAQAAVEERRSLTAYADAVAAESFDEAAVSDAGKRRVQSSTDVQSAVLKALRRIHALLRSEQRSRFAYLLRTGALSI